MIERGLMHGVLTHLETADTLGMREDIFMNELALDCPRHLEASTVREHLAEAKRLGWAERYHGALGETRWRITPSGANALRDF